MTYIGHVINGAIVLENPITDLPDGSQVELELAVTTPDMAPSLAEQFADVIGAAQGLPEDFARNHDHYIHGAQKR